MITKLSKVMIFGLLIFLFVLPIVSAAVQSPAEQLQAPNCNEYILNVTKSQQIISNLSADKAYYSNLSGYYKGAYEGANSCLTNGDVINVYQSLILVNQSVTALFKQVEEIKNELTFLKLNVSLSIIGGLALVDIGIRFVLGKIRKRRTRRTSDTPANQASY